MASQDSTIVIPFIGQIGTALREREAVQMVHFRRFPVISVKWVAEIDSDSRIQEFILRAFYAATSGRPGSVALALPETTLSVLAKPRYVMY